jgi:pSer/pThr/pTyr-binding forkhead associated (FHA) protein
VDVTLRCTAGPCAGETIATDSELLLGRDEPEPGPLGGDPRLSRRHARVFIDPQGRPMVEDLGSTNGTFINGERLTDAHVLSRGDELRAGQTTFDVEITPEPGGATQHDTIATGAPATIVDASPPEPALLVLAGPKEGEQIPLGDELLIGRGYGEPGALGGDSQLSRRHARIARGQDGVFFIQDTGSTNGTMLNGVALRRTHALSDGDEIQLGSSTLQVRGLPSGPFAADHADEPLAAPGFDPSRARGAAPAPAAAGPGGKHGPSGPRPAGAPASAPAPGGQFVPRGAAGARLSSRRVIGVFAGVFAAASIIGVLVVVLAAPLGSRACPQGFVCHSPPTAPPLHALTTFTGALHWRVEYDSQRATPATANATGNQLILRESDAQDKLWGASPGTGIVNVELRAFPSSQTSPQAAVRSLTGSIASNLVGAEAAPNSDEMFGQPVLGFHPAQGEVLEGNQKTPQGPGGLLKVAVLSSSSGGVTIAAAVIFPVQKGQTQQNNPDRPLDQFGDEILQTVRFPSDGAT